MKSLSFKGVLLPLMVAVSFFYGCKKPNPPANLRLDKIELVETWDKKYIDIPDGIYQPDHPDFSISKPHTWTGNMAQYVKHNYRYTLSYQITNLGGSVASGSEIDLFYYYASGAEELVTRSVGDIQPGATINHSFSIFCENKQLLECSGEVYWYEY